MSENMAKKTVEETTIRAIAKLSDLSIEPKKQGFFAKQFNETLEAVTTLERLNTVKVAPTNQVTGITNATREDIVDTGRMLPQQKALCNAKRTHQGYFVVKAIFDEQ